MMTKKVYTENQYIKKHKPTNLRSYTMTTVIKLQDGQQVQIKGKRPYFQDAHVFTLRGWHEKNPRFEIPADWDAYVKAECFKGGFEYGFTLAGTMLTDNREYNARKGQERDESPHLHAGDVVEVEGKQFKIVNQNNNNFGLEEIK